MSTLETVQPEDNKTFGVRDGSTGSLSNFAAFNPEEYTPCVRWGYFNEDGVPIQRPTLTPVSSPRPEEAELLSPVYFLSEEQMQRQESLSSEWAEVDGEYAGKALQDECEEAGRVLYPVYVESDAGDEGASVHEMREAEKEFVREYLGVDPENCQWYYSGGRSVHGHIPALVDGERLMEVKEAAEDFNEDSDIDLDTSIYKNKNQFRLPGVEHSDTGRPKTEISSNSSQNELRKSLAQSVEEDVTSPTTAEDILPGNYSGSSLVLDGATELVRLSGPAFSESNTAKNEGQAKEEEYPLKKAHLVDRENPPNDDWERKRWKQYNRVFSPYAKNEQGRSVALFTVKGGAFGRDEGDKQRTYLPVRMHASIGADSDFTVYGENAAIQISSRDYDKRTFSPEEGDTYALIGGRSGSSRIFELSSVEKDRVLLGFDNDPGRFGFRTTKQVVFDLLEQLDYETGSAGKNGPSRETPDTSEENNSPSEMRVLQQRIEAGEVAIQDLHDDRDRLLRLTNRLLRCRGWNGAAEWLRRQYGEESEESLIQSQLASIAKEWSDLPDGPEDEAETDDSITQQDI